MNNTTLLKEKIETLQDLSRILLYAGESISYVYADNLARLNKEIHDKINELYPLHGETVEQEASLCLAILMGFSVSMYANPEDEVKKRIILERSRKIKQQILPTSLKVQLTTICNEYENF